MTDRVTASIQNGLFITAAWVAATAIYVGLKFAKIEATEFGSVYVMITGGWVSGLGIILSRRNVATKETIDELTKVALRHHPEESAGLEAGADDA